MCTCAQGLWPGNVCCMCGRDYSERKRETDVEVALLIAKVGQLLVIRSGLGDHFRLPKLVPGATYTWLQKLRNVWQSETDPGEILQNYPTDHYWQLYWLCTAHKPQFNIASTCTCTYACMCKLANTYMYMCTCILHVACMTSYYITNIHVIVVSIKGAHARVPYTIRYTTN